MEGGQDDPAEFEAYNAAMQRVWVKLSLKERRLWHEFTCDNNRSGAHVMNAILFRAAVKDQMEEDRRRHAETAASVLNFMDQAGIQVKDPEPGQKVTILVTRVRDAMALGDDPYPALAARRVIVTCARCGENVFLDPASYGKADPEPVCSRCFDPRLAKMIEDEINGRPQG